jgi:hypothetical protein
VRECAVVRDCRRIGWMGVMWKVGIIYYSVSGYCGGDRDNVGGRRMRRGR